MELLQAKVNEMSEKIATQNKTRKRGHDTETHAHSADATEENAETPTTPNTPGGFTGYSFLEKERLREIAEVCRPQLYTPMLS